ncbi:sedoheptulokinase [Caerostris extrusa]|uniref:Sedoheptulokinase n=1 Tax=Caerostris extrusa TaxID=172846 RepID=A0AAV4RCQ1_CAEEX|nr:sedoheptulokinase [Caerostris extrusa]
MVNGTISPKNGDVTEIPAMPFGFLPRIDCQEFGYEMIKQTQQKPVVPAVDYFLQPIWIRLKEADFPLHLLPEVTIAGNIGRMPCAWYGSEGTPVFAALGDLQCSVFSSMETDHDAGE